ncbi:MAG TPA: LecA/PA-IL family lectin [Pyrinomonadaceae bacterium]|nr:LecA/PA-IL family lectin [Pyrinomonadaceae bacterium]
MKKLILVLLITLASVSIAAADTIYLRSGATLRGNVLGFINGRFAIELTSSATLPVNPANNRSQSTSNTRTVSAGEVIFLRPRDIDRIEIDGRSLDDARYQTRNVDVSLGSNWVDSGVDLRRGERVRVDASGTIYAGRSRITPAGLGTTDPSAPLPRAAEGELIGVVGNDYDSPIIEIGSSREFVAEREGRLYLTVNRGNYTDARGAFNARIRKEIDLTAMTRADESRNPNDNSYDPFGFPGESGTGPAPARSRQSGDYNQNRDRRGSRTLERIVAVQANETRGADTGIDLRVGDQVTITASGNITAGQRAGVVSPDGGRPSAGVIFGTNRRPVPTAGVGALVGFILQANGQQSQFFLVGSQATFTTPVDGRLYLLVNDDNYSDNSGSFSARIIYPDYR